MMLKNKNYIFSAEGEQKLTHFFVEKKKTKMFNDDSPPPSLSL